MKGLLVYEITDAYEDTQVKVEHYGSSAIDKMHEKANEILLLKHGGRVLFSGIVMNEWEYVPVEKTIQYEPIKKEQ